MQQELNKLEDILLREFREALHLARDERRHLERELAELRLEIEKAKSKKAGQIGILTLVGSAIGFAVASSTKILEAFGK